MRISLICVGRTDVSWIKQGLDDYVRRIGHYVTFGITEIPALKKTSGLTLAQIRDKEGDAILETLRTSDEVILLDEKGREYSSMEFAAFLQGKMNRSAANLVFIIGGPYGFSDAVYSRASGLLSLSRMTFTHQMVRTVFTEQLYRAMTILRGESYHHE